MGIEKQPKSLSMRLWNCKICWNITFAVFLSILIVEAAVLIPSYKNYERDELKRLENSALASIKTALMFVENTEAAHLRALNIVTEPTKFLGIRVYNLDGKLLLDKGKDILEVKNKVGKFGHWHNNLRAHDSLSYSVLWDQNDLGYPYKMTARLNAQDIPAILKDFIIRITILVGIIAGFVTIVTVFVIRKILLKRILSLKDVLIRASVDPTHPQNYMLKSDTDDELGDVIINFNELLLRLGHSLNEITISQLALEKSNKTLDKKVKMRTQELTEEIAERKKYEQELMQLANYDPITELPNKNLYKTRVDIFLGDIQNDEKVAIMTLEINELKEINDAFGQHISDKLLKHIGRIINNLSITHTVARIDNNQFGIISTPFANITSSIEKAKIILEIFAKPFTIDDNKIATSVNMGIAISPDNGKTSKELLRNADLALHRAKMEHPNSFSFYEESMNEKLEFKHNMIVDLHNAIDNEQFVLYFQPQYDLKTCELVGMETLVRWEHPDKGLVMPAEFIPIAESSGLIIQVGNWIINEAIAKTVEMINNSSYKDLRVSINLSAVQFKQKNLNNIIQDALTKHQLPSANVELEITESVVMDNIEEAIAIMHKLHDIGLQLSLDDFGTGYSSLNYLRRFPVQKIKIDQSFIRCINAESKDTNIADAIIFLGHSLGLKVIAEGVETDYQEKYLLETNCDEVQGFYYSRPMPYADFVKLLN